jgi:glycosyltransferase involved in cell wall biosynthesis
MTRLSILHTESSCGWGGQELRIISEAEGFRLRGHAVCIAAPPEARIYAEAGRRGLAALALPIAKKRPAGIVALRRELASRRWDVVNTHSSTDSWLAALALATLPRVARVPLVRTRHISAPISRNAATRWLYGSATAHVVTTGEALRRQVIDEAGLDAARVTSVPTGIDLERFCPGDRAQARAQLGLPADRFIVGIVATLRSWKGHRYLVEAIAALQDERAMLVIVGDGPGRDNLREQVRSLGLEGRVLMPGNQDDVVPWLRAFDLFVLPSYANEGVPQAIMQAMACACPVVTTPVGSIGEIVTDGETGLMVKPQDAASLETTIRRLRDDAELRSRLGQAGLVVAQERFAQAFMLERMEAIFQAAVRDGQSTLRGVS